VSKSHTPSKPPIDPKEGIAIARAAIAQAKAHGARAALAGGLAMLTYGSDRLTSDVDILTDDQNLSLGKRGKPLSFGGHSYTERGITLDIIIRNDEQKDVYDAALGDLHHRPPWKGEAPIAVLSPEWLVLIKLLAGRGKDLFDMRYLIRSRIINRKKLLDHCRRIYGNHAYMATDDLDQEFLLADAGIER
jgi:hypothetical protein